MKDRQSGSTSSSASGPPKRSRSLRVQIFVSTLVVGLIPIVLLAIVATLGLRNVADTADAGVATARRSLAAGAEGEYLIADAEAVAGQVDTFVAERVRDVATFARHPSVASEAYLADELSRNAAFAELTYHVEPSEEPWWVETMAAGAWVGPIALDSTGTGPVVPLAVRVADAGGTPIAVLRAGVAAEALHAIVDGSATAGQDVTIISTDRRLVAETSTGHDPARIAAVELRPDELPAAVDAAVGEGSGALANGGTINGFAPVAWSSAVTAADPDGAATIATDWTVVVTDSGGAALAPLADLDDLGRDLGEVRQQLALVTLFVLIVSVLACIVSAHILARKLVTPIRQLTTRARRAADEDLTAAVASIDDPVAESQVTLQDTAIELDAGNELDELAESFDSVHRTAIRMATEQAHLRQITSEMFANLGRRNQSLVKRQLRFIEELERSEEDPDRLASLFKLDHLATRMRRNAESLLVIAGHRGDSRRANPIRIELVTQAALGEVENYERVDTTAVEPASIMGRVVAGLAHVLAELIENALSFSPPEAPVQVTGERGPTSYTLTVVDRGIGLSVEELAEANERLTQDSDVDLTSSKQLGLLVVAKLASRYGFEVRLVPSPAGGVAARVEIPNTLVQPPERAPALPAPRPLSRQNGRAPSPAPAPAVGTPKLPPPSAVEDGTASPTPAPSPITPRPAPLAPAPLAPARTNPTPEVPAPAPAPVAPTPVAPALVAPAPEPEPVAADEPPSAPAPVPAPTAKLAPADQDDDGAARYIGSLSPTAASQLATVPRRASRRNGASAQPDDGPASQDRRANGSREKRTVATATSDEQVAAEATEVKTRWDRFRVGQRTAADAMETSDRATDGR